MLYDPDAHPDPSAWLAADEDERRAVIGQMVGHERLPPGANREAHAIVHETVENQIASRDPPEVAATLERLRGEGLGRHDAIHAIGTALTDQLFKILHDKRPFDRVAYVAALSKLSANNGQRAVRRRRT